MIDHQVSRLVLVNGFDCNNYYSPEGMARLAGVKPAARRREDGRRGWTTERATE